MASQEGADLSWIQWRVTVAGCGSRIDLRAYCVSALLAARRLGRCQVSGAGFRFGYVLRRTKDKRLRVEMRLDRPGIFSGVRGEDHSGQVTKGVWGMSWRQKAMKGVEGCEKPGEAVKQALIPGFPNVAY